jgi:hypothetical protein
VKVRQRVGKSPKTYTGITRLAHRGMYDKPPIKQDKSTRFLCYMSDGAVACKSSRCYRVTQRFKNLVKAIYIFHSPSSAVHTERQYKKDNTTYEKHFSSQHVLKLMSHYAMCFVKANSKDKTKLKMATSSGQDTQVVALNKTSWIGLYTGRGVT